jgi:hypothetical protein
METTFIDIVKKLVAEQGKETLLNQSKCKSFLADYTKGEYKDERDLLLRVLESGCQNAIMNTTDIESIRPKIVRQLVVHYKYIAEQAIAEIVDLLVLVMRGIEAQSGTALEEKQAKAQKEAEAQNVANEQTNKEIENWYNEKITQLGNERRAQIRASENSVKMEQKKIESQLSTLNEKENSIKPRRLFAHVNGDFCFSVGILLFEGGLIGFFGVDLINLYVVGVNTGSLLIVVPVFALFEPLFNELFSNSFAKLLKLKEKYIWWPVLAHYLWFIVQVGQLMVYRWNGAALIRVSLFFIGLGVPLLFGLVFHPVFALMHNSFVKPKRESLMDTINSDRKEFEQQAQSLNDKLVQDKNNIENAYQLAKAEADREKSELMRQNDQSRGVQGGD